MISGCASRPEPIETATVEIKRPELVLPEPDQLNLREVNWIVVNRKNADEVLDNVGSNEDFVSVIGLTPSDYTRMSLNLNDLRSFIQQQQVIIEAYRQYYIETDKIMDELEID